MSDIRLHHWLIFSSALVLALTPTPGLAEVMDKEPSASVLWLSALIAIGLSLLLSLWRPWAALLITPVAAAVGLFFLADSIWDPDVGPGILREAGQGYVRQAYIAVALAIMCGPIIAMSPILGSRRHWVFWGLALVVASFLSIWFVREMRIDSCIDRGGRWVYDHSACDGASR